MEKVKIHDCKNNTTIFNTEKWVKYEDYAKLESRYNKLLEQVKQKDKLSLDLFSDSRSLLAECLKFAIEDTGRISGDHDGNAGLLYTHDTYEIIADDFLEARNNK